MLNVSGSQIQRLDEDIKSLKIDNARIMGSMFQGDEAVKNLEKKMSNSQIVIRKHERKEQRSSRQKSDR
jgi:hypothetical protein